MVDWVRNTCVLCHALVSEVNLAVCINCNVLKKSIALDSVEDVRLALLVEVDNLCVATALEVEYALVVPTVLVVTDELTLRIGRKGRLTRTRQTEDPRSAR